jgi:hypothetical protein
VVIVNRLVVFVSVIVAVARPVVLRPISGRSYHHWGSLLASCEHETHRRQGKGRKVSENKGHRCHVEIEARSWPQLQTEPGLCQSTAAIPCVTSDELPDPRQSI